jgi:hypothetical protein
MVKRLPEKNGAMIVISRNELNFKYLSSALVNLWYGYPG